MHIWLAPLLVAALLAPPSRPGVVSFQRIAMAEDVPAQLCSALAQDARGYLWIGSQDGLVRYDGYGFRTYQARPDDARSLGGNYIRSLLPARDGRLWAGSFSGGLSVLDAAGESFLRYRHDPRRADSLGNDRVEGLAEEADGSLWVATDEGLDRFDPKTQGFEHFRHRAEDPGSVSHDQVRGLLLDSRGQLWVGTRDGLQVRAPGQRSFVRVHSAHGEVGSLAGQFVNKIFEDRRGRIWIGTAENGAAVLDPATGSFQRLQNGAGLSHFWVYGFAEVRAGDDDEIWIATFGGGIDVLDAATLAPLDHLHHDAALPDTIGADRIGAVLVDRAGVAWVGSWGGGLSRHDPSGRAFVHLRYSPTDPTGLSHPAVVRALQVSDGSLWLGTNGNGIDVLGPRHTRVAAFRPDAKNPGALADGSVTCLAEGPDGSRWVATLDGTLHRLRRGASRFERFSATEGMPRGPVRTLAFGPGGQVWAGAAEGLARIDPASRRVVRFAHQPGDDSTPAGRAIEGLAFARDGTLWVGTDDGLDAFDPARGTVRLHLRHDPSRPDSLPDNWVPDLMLASDGALWVATQVGAAVLIGLEGATAHFLSVSGRTGLPPRPVESLIEDAAGQVWLGPRARVDPHQWTARSFGPAEGNDAGKPYIASRARTRAGELLFGTPDGLMIVSPRKLSDWTFQPQVVATAVEVDGAARAATSVQLAPGERALRVEFAALDLSAPERLRYRYRLDGFDRDWNQATATQRSATYTELPPGDYLLLVQGSNRAGQFSPREVRLPVRVVPAFYQTRWFRSLLVLAILLIAYAASMLRTVQLRRRSLELERLVAERTAALEDAKARLEEASVTDPLTLLRNRRFFESAIPSDLSLVQRRHSMPGPADPESDLLFFMLDLDHFKEVNDRFGHAAGDAVLAQFAGRLKYCVRSSDHVVRWGGEEFLIVARFVDRASAPGLAEKLRATIAAEPFRLPDGKLLPRTVSLGFAAYPFSRAAPEATTLDGVLKLADAALYAAKRSGRNTWVGLEPLGEEPIQPQLVDEPAAAVASGRLRAVALRELVWP